MSEKAPWGTLAAQPMRWPQSYRRRVRIAIDITEYRFILISYKNHRRFGAARNGILRQDAGRDRSAVLEPAL